MARGDLSVEVQPGCAIDGRGNQIVQWTTTVKSFRVDNKNELLQYLVIRYTEQPTDFIAYKHNLAIRGHRRMQDSCEIEVTETEPKIESEVELCRVLVGKGATEVREPRDWINPGANEINRLGVSRSGVCGSTLNADMRKLTDKVFFTLRSSLRQLAKARCFAAHDAMAMLNQIRGLYAVDLFDKRDMPELMWLLIEQLAFIYDDLVTNHADVVAKKEKELIEYFKQVKMLRPLVWKSKNSDRDVKDLYLNLQRAGDLLGPIAAAMPTGPVHGAKTMIKF
jgi:hypothetical protein